jgi:aryl-phospho-beta-D-glucosidase BglC (GH1 family)
MMYTRSMKPAMERIDKLVQAAHKMNLHVSLNLHRAPGYCINAGLSRAVQFMERPAGDGCVCVSLEPVGQAV